MSLAFYIWAWKWSSAPDLLCGYPHLVIPVMIKVVCFICHIALAHLNIARWILILPTYKFCFAHTWKVRRPHTCTCTKCMLTHTHLKYLASWFPHSSVFSQRTPSSSLSSSQALPGIWNILAWNRTRQL